MCWTLVHRYLNSFTFGAEKTKLLHWVALFAVLGISSSVQVRFYVCWYFNTENDVANRLLIVDKLSNPISI